MDELQARNREDENRLLRAMQIATEESWDRSFRDREVTNIFIIKQIHFAYQ